MNFKVGDVLSDELIRDFKPNSTNSVNSFNVDLQSRFAFFIKKITLLNDSDLNGLNDLKKLCFSSQEKPSMTSLYKIDVILIKIENLN